MCAGPVFSLVFLCQSCSVFLSCGVWQFVFAQQNNMYETIFMRSTITCGGAMRPHLGTSHTHFRLDVRFSCCFRVGQQTPGAPGGAAPRRCLVRRVVFLAGRAARPSKHEGLFGFACKVFLFNAFLAVFPCCFSYCRFQHVTPRDLAVAQHFQDRRA